MFLAIATHWLLLYAALIIMALVLLIFGFIVPRLKRKAVETELRRLDGALYVLKKADKALAWDYELKLTDGIVFVKVVDVPAHSLITINRADTWQLEWGGSAKKRGHGYTQKRILTELTAFLTEEFPPALGARKIVLINPATEALVRHVNEVEVEPVDIFTPYGYAVVTCDYYYQQIKEFLSK